ncbi:hypothetical protein HRR83_003617 [Exophiala dermatitidis]|nr:hypothetical protein HRR74_003003 [Exophiala dermatitidis]KAJ4529743.1 hypothetical protein HRR73_000771 [Exophiala dermatitidis]KAJ4543090.1 hypothetical protein HRR77_005350 [Exophiala dermatitidis]KAJ4543591.1 hypothetical protein HRR76_001658 [Exophiala dermatitidis]KAJ4575055.1 hypothetical protein HRR79_001988 [Exophiala dermatitidis]
MRLLSARADESKKPRGMNGDAEAEPDFSVRPSEPWIPGLIPCRRRYDERQSLNPRCHSKRVRRGKVVIWRMFGENSLRYKRMGKFLVRVKCNSLPESLILSIKLHFKESDSFDFSAARHMQGRIFLFLG